MSDFSGTFEEWLQQQPENWNQVRTEHILERDILQELELERMIQERQLKQAAVQGLYWVLDAVLLEKDLCEIPF